MAGQPGADIDRKSSKHRRLYAAAGTSKGDQVSGIAGIFNRDGRPVNPADLNRMLDTIAHRGPDGSGIWHDGSVGFGHRMLWTTPESLHEKLPYYRSDAYVAITADARIDNRDELMGALGIQKRTEAMVTDSELILIAYLKWGDQAPVKLIGDFAFTVWDSREQSLFCARDPMGIKPFYYHHSLHQLCFASEIAAILSLPEIPRILNLTAIADFLTPVYIDPEQTFFKDIYILEPAHTLTINMKGELLKKKYWTVDPDHELKLESDTAYAEAFSEIFNEAVRCRLRSTSPVGVSFSGGLDSSAILCTANAMNLASDQRLHTFSAIFPETALLDPAMNDLPFIEEVLRHCQGLINHYVNADASYPFTDEPIHLDEPVSLPNIYIYKSLFRASRDQQVRVLLSGIGGDETVSYGYEYLEYLAYQGQWSAFATEAGLLVSRDPFMRRIQQAFFRFGRPHIEKLSERFQLMSFYRHAKSISSALNRPQTQIWWQHGIKPALRRNLVKLKMYSNNSEWESFPLNRALSSSFIKQVNLEERIRHHVQSSSKQSDTIRQNLIHGMNTVFQNHILAAMDKISARLTVEQRYPFFDRRLIELCISLPFDQKLKNGWTRSILRRAMQQILPTLITTRYDKGNISSGICMVLMREKNVLADIFCRGNHLLSNFQDMAQMNSMLRISLYEPLKMKNSEVFSLFLTAVLGQWLLNESHQALAAR